MLYAGIYVQRSKVASYRLLGELDALVLETSRDANVFDYLTTTFENTQLLVDNVVD